MPTKLKEERGMRDDGRCKDVRLSHEESGVILSAYLSRVSKVPEYLIQSHLCTSSVQLLAGSPKIRRGTTFTTDRLNDQGNGIGHSGVGELGYYAWVHDPARSLFQKGRV